MSGVKLVAANAVDQSTRSQVVAIKMKACTHLAATKDNYEKMLDWFMLKYRQHLDQHFGRAREDKVRAINQVLDFEHKYLAELEYLNDYCDLVIDDIDQTAYALQRLGNLFESLSPSANKERRLG